MEQRYFDELMASLQDAAAFAQGDTSRGRVVVREVKAPSYKAADAARARQARHRTNPGETKGQGL